jgi:hypothetical protein
VTPAAHFSPLPLDEWYSIKGIYYAGLILIPAFTILYQAYVHKVLKIPAITANRLFVYEILNVAVKLPPPIR